MYLINGIPCTAAELISCLTNENIKLTFEYQALERKVDGFRTGLTKFAEMKINMLQLDSNDALREQKERIESGITRLSKDIYDATTRMNDIVSKIDSNNISLTNVKIQQQHSQQYYFMPVVIRPSFTPTPFMVQQHNNTVYNINNNAATISMPFSNPASFFGSQNSNPVTSRDDLTNNPRVQEVREVPKTSEPKFDSNGTKGISLLNH